MMQWFAMLRWRRKSGDLLPQSRLFCRLRKLIGSGLCVRRRVQVSLRDAVLSLGPPSTSCLGWRCKYFSLCGSQRVAYFVCTLMEICDALRSASAQAVCVLPLRLVALVRAQQEYAFGLLFGAVEHKDPLMWQFLMDVFGSPISSRTMTSRLGAECRW